MSDDGWIRVGRTSEFENGRPRAVQLDDLEIFVCRSGGDLFAAENACSHAGFPLADGDVEAGTVLCPLHGAAFDLKTGEPLSPPADLPIRTFPVRETGGEVFVKRS